MSSLFAFLHHFAAFTLVSALVAEFVLMREALSISVARKIQIADAVFGMSAGIILVVGLTRVFYFEKGAAYYFSNSAFLAKLALFILVGCLSIYPTKEFLSWSRATRTGQAPDVDRKTRQRLQNVIHMELIALVLIIFCAALMAHGIGSF